MGSSWRRGVVVEIARVLVVVKVRAQVESGVEVLRGVRRARAALLRAMFDSDARIVSCMSFSKQW